ncbi:hypothetical protein BCR35DRAFT_303633 [Leucosporidium creatinivorum]|uniref:Histone H1 n=1 Tax=Leucosporidium creatinivorum TaxID=106004 RepID=A0A1Y2FGE1_9BASI|nr:hypothetical protein BCR35DRAFT_303633 [Leucosporidium creatinivorum]
MPKAAKTKVSKPTTKAIVEEACYYAEEAKGVSQVKILRFGAEQGYFNADDGRTKANVKKAIEGLVGNGRLIQTKQSFALAKEVRQEYDELAETTEEEVPVKKTPAKKKAAATPKTQSAPKKKSKK